MCAKSSPKFQVRLRDPEAGDGFDLVKAELQAFAVGEGIDVRV